MKATVSKKDLLRVLARCQAVADKKSTLPVLANVLIETVGTDQIRLAATDLYLAVSGTVPAQVDAAGSVAVPARDLFDRVRMMPEGQIAISVADNSATTIRAVGAARRFTIHGIPGDEFPNLPEPDDGAAVLDLEAATLADLIASTQFSISADETRLHLNSALFNWYGNRVRMVTTDGRRLSKREIDVDECDAKAEMLIPLRGIAELKRLCDDAKDDGSIAMSQSGAFAFFDLAGFRFVVKLVDGQFPPYQQVIPETSAHTVRAPRAQLADALRAVSVSANDRTGGVRLSLSSGKMRLDSESPESGEGSDEVPVDYSGPDAVVGLNAHYLLDVLGAMTDDEIEIGMGGELDPIVVRPAETSDTADYLSVVMPMRI